MKIARNTFALLFFLYAVVTTAQVGIGTPTPAATLDITAANLAGTTVDGLLVPRVSRLRAQTMLGTPTSTIIFVNNIATGTASGTTVNVTTTGFYFFNGSVWEKLGSAATTAWDVSGNSGLSGSTNFLGTTDDVDVAFRRNSSPAGKIGTISTSFGVNALSAGVATNNAAFGTNALAQSTGADNVAVGNGTLSVNTTGIQNTGVGNAALAANKGSASTAVGWQALNANTTGSNSTAMGFRALATNTTSSNNTAIGFEALTTNTNGGSNTALGFQSSRSNTTGYQNTAIGDQALYFTSSGYSNTAIGRHALHDNTGSNNTALGQQALLRNQSATANTAVGSDALLLNSGASNTALGYAAGSEHSTGANNTYIGSEAGRYSSGLSTTSNNVFLGYQSGLYSSGSFNTAIGANTLKANIGTTNNVAIGYNALTNNQGTGNIAIGYNAGAAETGSNKLYIQNSNANSNNALIYGEFNTKIVRVNGTLQISDPLTTLNGYALPIVRGTNGQTLQTDGAGGTSWVSNPANSLSMVSANLTANQTLFTGWQKINFNTETFDTGNEFNTVNGRFTATKAGFYRINAAYHTNSQGVFDQFSIGIYVNNALYRLNSSDHAGSGIVERTISGLVQLNIGDYVEIFAENFPATGVNIDSYSGKTFFEVQQVR